MLISLSQTPGTMNIMIPESKSKRRFGKHMLKSGNKHKTSAPKNTKETPRQDSSQEAIWEEYSLVHDSLAELFSYENSRRASSDIWELHYV